MTSGVTITVFPGEAGLPPQPGSLPTCPLNPLAGVQGGGHLACHCLHCTHCRSGNVQARRAWALCLARPCQEPPGKATFPPVALHCLTHEGPTEGVLPLTLISHLPWSEGLLVREPSLALLSTCCAPWSRYHQIGECDAPHTLCSGSQVWGRWRVGRGWAWRRSPYGSQCSLTSPHPIHGSLLLFSGRALRPLPCHRHCRCVG